MDNVVLVVVVVVVVVPEAVAWCLIVPAINDRLVGTNKRTKSMTTVSRGGGSLSNEYMCSYYRYGVVCVFCVFRDGRLQFMTLDINSLSH